LALPFDGMGPLTLRMVADGETISCSEQFPKMDDACSKAGASLQWGQGLYAILLAGRHLRHVDLEALQGQTVVREAALDPVYENLLPNGEDGPLQ